MNRICFGMPTLIENRDLAENISLCRELGLDFIELNMNFPEFQLDSMPDADELKRVKEEYGLFFTLHLDEKMNAADFNPLVRQAYTETALRAIELAGAISAPVINMHMNPGVYITLPDRKEYLYARGKDIYLSYLASFRDLCTEKIGNSDVKICVENTDGWRDFEREAVDMLLESPAFRITWDIGHSKATGEKDLPFLTAREDRLYHFHIHDGSETPPRNHLALGDGCIPLEERLALAAKHGCRCVLETKTVQALRTSVCWLRERGYMDRNGANG